MDDIKNIASTLDNILAKADLSKVTADSAGFSDLNDGYYLCEVMDAELKTSKTSGNPMVALKLKVIDNGWELVKEDDMIVNLKQTGNTKGRYIFKNYVLTDEQSVKRFVSDMLKFENPEEQGESILGAEYFLKTDTLLDALDIIKSGLRIYVYLSSYTKSSGEKGTNQNLVKWSAIEDIAEEYNVPLV